MKAVGKFRFIKDRSDPGYRAGKHDDFEASTIDATRHRYEGQKMNGTLYSVDPEVWALELYPTTDKEDSTLVWDGEGLPPVGCEFLFGTHQTKAKCIAVGRDVIFASTGNPDEKDGFYEEFVISIHHSEFRPIRSEADKKRDESIKALKFSFGAFDVNGLADMVYHAIAAGKIPHIRID